MRGLTILATMLMAAVRMGAQGYNGDRVAFTNFLVRMCQDAPFEGVRAVSDYDKAYLISVLALDGARYGSESEMNRVALVKAMSQASRYLSGSSITRDMVIHVRERADGTSDTEIVENIREHSAGYVKALEQLTNFTNADGWRTFIFMAPLTGEWAR